MCAPQYTSRMLKFNVSRRNQPAVDSVSPAQRTKVAHKGLMFPPRRVLSKAAWVQAMSLAGSFPTISRCWRSAAHQRWQTRTKCVPGVWPPNEHIFQPMSLTRTTLTRKECGRRRAAHRKYMGQETMCAPRLVPSRPELYKVYLYQMMSLASPSSLPLMSAPRIAGAHFRTNGHHHHHHDHHITTERTTTKDHSSRIHTFILNHIPLPRL